MGKESASRTGVEIEVKGEGTPEEKEQISANSGGWGEVIMEERKINARAVSSSVNV